jgi:hypothetical protein
VLLSPVLNDFVSSIQYPLVHIILLAQLGLISLDSLSLYYMYRNFHLGWHQINEQRLFIRCSHLYKLERLAGPAILHSSKRSLWFYVSQNLFSSLNLS